MEAAKVKRSGTGNKSLLRRGEVFWNDFLEANQFRDSRARYWLRCLKINLRKVVYPKTNKARAVISATQQKQILRAIDLTHNKLEYLTKGRSKGAG